jgi:WD40 repeat protein
MPRREKPLDLDGGVLVEFAADLRRLREKAGGLPYRELSKLAHYSPSVLAEAAGGRKLPSLAVTLAYVRACGGDCGEWQTRWRALAAELVTADAEVVAQGETTGAPYVGLAAFQPDDANRFFGRERLVTDLLDRVRERRFLAVFGASGSGKSSVLRAGLVARTMAEGNPVLLLTPGPHPREECAVGLAAFTGASAAVLRTELAADPENLHLRVRQALIDRPAGSDLLLVIDQFEEVFTLCRAHDERAWFIQALVGAARAATSRVRVVLGVRADFYGHCGQHPELVEALRDGQLLVGPMTADELRQAITAPAGRAGYTVETALVSRLVADAAGQPAALPLVSHALRETWRRRRGTRLTLAGYEEVGGIAQAVARSAEHIYSSLDAVQQGMAKQLFLRLTAMGEGTEDTKRRISRHELDTDPDPAVVLETLAAARLVTVGQESVEIAHEALIRGWPRLGDWLREDREGLRIHRQLTDATQAWDALHRDPGSLFRGARLALTQGWAERHDDALSVREREFLRASDREEQRGARRLRRLVAALAVVSLLAGAAAITAFLAEQRARQERDLAVAHEVIARAPALHAINPGLAVQLAVAAYRLAPDLQTRSGLLSTVASPHFTRLEHPDTVTTVAFSPNGRWLATTNNDHNVRLWQLADASTPQILAGHTGLVESSAFRPDGQVLATGSEDGTVRLWDLGDRNLPLAVIPLQAPPRSVAFSPDGRTLLTGGDDHTAHLWDVSQPHQPSPLGILEGHFDRVLAVAFSPDGRTAATAGADRTARLWNVADPHRSELMATLSEHNQEVESVAFSPDGHTLATSSADHTARLWDVSTPRQPVGLAVLAGHSDQVNSVAFSPDGRILATGSADLTTRLWDVTNGRQPAELSTLTGHTQAVISVAFSPDGHTLATGSEDNSARVWPVPGPVLTGHTDLVLSAAFTPDGRILASTGYDRTVRIWDTADLGNPHVLAILAEPRPLRSVALRRDGRLLAVAAGNATVYLWDLTDPQQPTPAGTVTGHVGTVRSVAFSPDGHTLATGGEDHTARLWDVSDPTKPSALATLDDHTDRVMTVAFSPDGHTLATGSYDRTAKLWDATDPRHPTALATLTGHTHVVRSVAFSPDGHTLATASWDRTAKLWDATDPRHPTMLATLPGHTGPTNAVTFSPDGHTLATGGDDGAIRLWEISNPHEPANTAILTGHTDLVFALVFHPDGHTLATAGRDRTIRLWDTNPDLATHHACSLAGPPITQDQWSAAFGNYPYTPPCR